MRACPECGKRVTAPEYRHACPHGRLCIGPSIHRKRSVHAPKVLGQHRRQYCEACADHHEGGSP